MARAIKCPHCGQVMKVAEQAAGKRVDCPACKKAFLAPKALAKPPTPTAPAAAAATPSRVWYVNVDGRNDGPHGVETLIEQVKSGRLDSQTLAWKEGMGDWQPLGEVPEFHAAFVTPPPVTKSSGHRARPARRGLGEGGSAHHEQEPRAHYSRAHARRDVSVGLWVAGGLALAAVVALVIVLNQKDSDDTPAWKPVVSPIPTSALESGATVVIGPRPLNPPQRPPSKAPVKGERLLASLATDMEAGFKAAIAAHRKGQATPIYRLGQKLKSHAEKLAAHQWGAHQGDVETLVKRLNDASEGILTTLKERSEAWGLGDGVDEKKRAELLELDKFEWLENWDRILREEVERLRNKGLSF